MSEEDGTGALSGKSAESRSEIERRLADAASDVDRKRRAWRESIELRNEVVFEAIDIAGLSHRQAARALGMTVQSVERILSGN